MSIATPLVFNGTVPRVVVPSAKTTFPVGVIGPVEVTLAVSVTDWPYVDGFKLEAKLVEVVYLSTT